MNLDDHRLREAAWSAVRLGRRASRSAFLARLHAAAWLVGATVDASVAVDAQLAPNLAIEIEAGSANRLQIGTGSRLRSGVALVLRGGAVEIGPGSDLRRFVTLNVSGVLRIGQGVMLSPGVFVHCDDLLVIDDLAIIGAYSVLADTTHVRTPAGTPVHHSAKRTAPTRIGRNVALGVHTAISLGVEIGDEAIVGANSVVTEDVPAGWLAVGSPARAVRELVVGE